MVGVFDPACELLPPWAKELSCVLLPIYLLSDLSPPLPKLNVQFLCEAVGGESGGVLNCAVDYKLQVFHTLFLTRFRTYKIAPPPQTK